MSSRFSNCLSGIVFLLLEVQFLVFSLMQMFWCQMLFLLVSLKIFLLLVFLNDIFAGHKFLEYWLSLFFLQDTESIIPLEGYK